MNKRMILINICLLLGIFISCEVEKKNNKNDNIVEEIDNSIPVYRYLEKRDTEDLPVKSWRYDSYGNIEEYCEYDSRNPEEIKVTVYDNDTDKKEKIGSQVLKYANNEITGKTELLEKRTYDIAKKEVYKAVKTINDAEIEYIEKENGEVLNCSKSEYDENNHLIVEKFYDDEFQNLTEKLDYEYDEESNKISNINIEKYHYVDDDDKYEVKKIFKTKYFYGIDSGSYRKETFLIKNNSDDIKDSCEVIEYELDESGDVVKEHVMSDGKDQNYTIYTYGEYKGKKYKQNVVFYNNVETDNQLIEKEEYRYYDDNDSNDYFYEEMRYYYSDKYDYEDEEMYDYIFRSKSKTIKGRNENVNR